MDNARILIIEDNPIIVDLLKYTLTLKSENEEHSFDIACAYDGVQGLELAQKIFPDVVILDIHLPRLDGYGVLQALHAMERTPLAIVLSALRREDVKQEFLAEQDIYMSKPFSPALLYHQVLEQLRKKRHQLLSQQGCADTRRGRWIIYSKMEIATPV